MTTRKPNFLIVGAAKSGTTSLFEYLRRHPDIYMPSCKETGFFSERNEAEVITIEDYLEFFASAKDEKRIGEASTAYLYSQDAPLRISECLGNDIQIIIILRDPVMMAYSLWGQNVRDGGEKLSFEDAVNAEKDRMNNDVFHRELKTWWIHNYAYKDRAKYAPQVERYLKTFGSDNVKVYIYEYFFEHVDISLKDVYRFLEVDTSFRPAKYDRYNPAGTVKSKLLHKLYSEKTTWTDPLRTILPAPIRRGITMGLYKINTRAQPLPPLSPLVKNRLMEYFRDDIRKLEKILGQPLSEIWHSFQ